MQRWNKKLAKVQWVKIIKSRREKILKILKKSNVEQLLVVRLFNERWWNKIEDFFGNEWNWKSGRIFIFQNRLDSISSFISTLFDSWKDYEYRRGENYFLMVFFMTVSQPATFKRNAKGERTMAHIFCKYFETFLDDIFVSLFETSRFVSSRVYQGLFRERKWDRFGMVDDKEDRRVTC